MNIYIANDYQGNPIAVLLAVDKKTASLAWMGTNVRPHSIEEINPNENLGINGVAYLMSSTESEICISGKFQKVRQWKRGI